MSTGRDIVNISSCLEQVKLRNALLVTTVSEGQIYQDLFESEQVKNIINENNAVTINIAHSSQQYTQFAECYKLGTPPFICFIAPNGVVLEAIRGEISQEYFIRIFKYALLNIKKGKEENCVYYPLTELVNIPVPDIEHASAVVEEAKVEKQIFNTDKRKPGISLKTANPKPVETMITKRQIMSSNCRIKFTLPDGSSVSDTFEATTTLAELKTFLRDRNPGMKAVIIIRPHPREEFQPHQDVSTLQELDIRTGSGLIVHNVTSEIAASRTSIFTAIFSFFAAIWAYFFPARKNQTPAQQYSPTNTASSSLRQNAKSNSSTRGIARRGNMVRLSDLRDKDDENNTYNGNSTQQQ